MKHRPRAWRITMWTSLAATVLLAGGAIGTRRWIGPFSTRGLTTVDGWMFGVEAGAVVVGRFGIILNGFWRERCRDLHSDWLWYRDYSDTFFATGWDMGISLWLPAGATFAVTSLSALKLYRFRLPGHCPCGYNRSGLPTDAPCPECGRPPSHV